MTKDIKGYEGLYTVDEFGNITSVKRRKRKETTVFPNGYEYVHLHKNGTSKCLRVHRIVAEAFIPNPHEYNQVNHINGIKTDNRMQNLEWCDMAHNMQHAERTGLFNVKGEANPGAKLTLADVVSIRSEYVRNSKTSGTVALAKKYGVSNVMIGKIIRGENWKEGFDVERSMNREKGDI